MSEIPKYIKYDFFMALLGLITIYFTFTNDRVYKTDFFNWGFLIGSACLLYGIYSMKKNYDEEQDMGGLRRKLEKNKLKEELKSEKKIKQKIK